VKYAKLLLFLVFAALLRFDCPGQTPTKPLLGAQIWIEPGQTPAQIDGWFQELAKQQMPVARVFIMWPYIEPARDQWDFTLYDETFRSAEKYKVKIVATLTPTGIPPFMGGSDVQNGGIVGSEDARKESAQYIAKVVERYKGSPALDTWLLANEPGEAPKPQALAITKYRIWLEKQYGTVAALNRSWTTGYKSFAEVDPALKQSSWNANSAIDWDSFWREYQTAGLQWIADEVHQHDKAHPLHVNPHALISNLAGLSDDLPAWRAFLDTMGCSIHPAWHFGLLSKDRYALGVSYINDLVAGSIEPKPHWVTELQGGNNIYSGAVPMEPTADETAQWVWTSIGAGADRVIFWLLNARRSGVEAAEWSMLDLNQKPSVRLETSAAIATTINEHQEFFSSSTRVESPITVILSLETMTLEEHYADPDYPGRGKNAHILEALGFYEALSRIGPPPNLKFFHDFDWRTKTAQTRTAILPDARAITREQVDDLKAFVANGNTLLISGLTGFYDPHAAAWSFMGFPLGEVTGGSLKEVHFVGDRFSISLDTPEVTMPSHLWASSIENVSAQPEGHRNGELIATERTTVNGGKVIWIPSPIGLGAWLTDSEPLAGYLRTALAPAIASEPFTLKGETTGCLLRVLKTAHEYGTVVTNGSSHAASCAVEHPAHLKASAIWGKIDAQTDTDALFHLEPGATTVALWK